MDTNIERSLFLAFVRVHILYHACNEEVYGSYLVHELSRHGYALSYGTIYPILHALEKDCLLSSEKRNVHGKVRRYYRGTALGEDMLMKARERIAELVDEVM